jgi:hypothetical protein
MRRGKVRAVCNYASESCVWTSKDPIRFIAGTNLYVYGENDPVDETDPSGLILGGSNPYAAQCAIFGKNCNWPIPDPPPSPGPGPGPGGGGGGGAGGVPAPGGAGNDNCSKPDKQFCRELQNEATDKCVEEVMVNNPWAPGDKATRIRNCVRDVMHSRGCDF